MTDEQILEMLKELVEWIDYDIYKAYFVEACWECSEDEAVEAVQKLVDIVKKHVPSESVEQSKNTSLQLLAALLTQKK